ncbi:major type 1 subunit fimbrin (pilin) [Pseudomonas sp. SLBN-26]|uniref:fimbrial protein n=1 Tax=Pseudomonadaceae TaxID=135621 RepID=UPI0011542073|nr:MULTISPECIES: fimbrial protein [Pseudomonas]MCP1618429.1 major type 1 subunit fimbrin (pilin) [Pseudomonas otitidis]MDU9397239.1 fimbrial protein [Pseudomonas sp. zfem003]TQL07664.1 major type 1 subunit fimbrin (pilin) [Pseudomonas sp. SLBN-26]
MIRKLVTSAAVLALSASSLSAYAYSDADGAEIHFTGKILEKTCTVAVNGVPTPGAATVTLPDTQAALLRIAGQTAGDTPFVISLKDCKTNASSADVLFTSAYLDGDQLSNIASTGAATNVALELTDNNGTPVDLSGQIPTIMSLNAGQGSATYKVRYYAKDVVEPGAVEATALYVIGYP